MRILAGMAIIGLVIIPVQAYAASDEAQRPEDGATRLGRVFPEQALAHVADSAEEHAGPVVLKNWTKDPRNDRAHEVVTVGE